MAETNVGANLMFALQTKNINEPMSEIKIVTLTYTYVQPYIGWILFTTIYPKIYERLLNTEMATVLYMILLSATNWQFHEVQTLKREQSPDQKKVA